MSISALTLRNGTATGSPPGGIGGGVLNAGALTINNAAIMANASDSTGGGIHNEPVGSLTITDSTISGNRGSGGGIYNSGALTIVNSTLASNSVSIVIGQVQGQGAGIYNSESGTATILGSTIQENRNSVTGPRGGGIYNLGTLTVAGSAITDNRAVVTSQGGLGGFVFSGNGGGIYNESGTMSVTNTTISGNSAAYGGGIYNAAQMSVSSSTISSNQGVPYRLNPFAPGGLSNRGTLTLQNTIIAQNISPGYPDFDGVAMSNGNNLIGNKIGSSGWVESDLVDVDARLAPLADNGGPTMTHALLADSPAIDAGNDAGAPATDQRGNRRPRDGDGDGLAISDIGAFEFALGQSGIEAVHDTATVDEDTTNNVINVLANDRGPIGGTLSVFDVTDPGHGTALIAEDKRSVLYTPAPNFIGTDTFAYTVRDGLGGAATAMVTVTVSNADTDFQGTPGDDAYFVRRDAPGANVQVFDNATGEGTPIFTQSHSTLDFLLIESLDGNDQVIVDLINGNPIPAGGIQFLGGNSGAAGDRLTVRDARTASGTYTAHASTSGSGVVTIGGRNVSLTSVEPIEVAGLTSFTVVTPGARDVLTVSSTTGGTTQLGGTSDGMPLSPVLFAGIGTFIIDAATSDAGAGDDSLAVSADDVVPENLGFLQYRSGSGANRLMIETGAARIDSTVVAGGTLDTTLASRTQLVTHRFRQTSLAIGNAARAVVLPDGTDAGTSLLDGLIIDGGGTLDINDNALIVNYTGQSPVGTIRQTVLDGRGDAGIGSATWMGTGVTSSAAAQSNATAPDSRSVGYADNSLLPLGPYATFRGQPVDATAVLIAYTRTGDASLDGVVNDDDVTIVGATFAPGVAQPHWALGDFDYNGFVDDDDVTLLGALYEPSATPLAAPAAPVGWAEAAEAHAQRTLLAPQTVPEDRQEIAPAVRPGNGGSFYLDRSGGPTPVVARSPNLVVAPSRDPVVARSPDRAIAPTAGLPAPRARPETFDQAHVRRQETRGQQLATALEIYFAEISEPSSHRLIRNRAIGVCDAEKS
jgi:hypothetical protein